MKPDYVIKNFLSDILNLTHEPKGTKVFLKIIRRLPLCALYDTMSLTKVDCNELDKRSIPHNSGKIFVYHAKHVAEKFKIDLGFKKTSCK